MSALRVAVVDDERIARRTLLSLLEASEHVEVVGQAANGGDALRLIADADPDVVFLDVQMPGLDGVEVARRLARGEGPAIVFTTAFDEYAIEAFELAAVDYLLKPFDDERFRRALARARRRVESDELRELRQRMLDLASGWGTPTPVAGGGVAEPSQDDVGVVGPDGTYRRLVVRSAGRVRFVDVDDIEWIEAADYCARIHVGDGDHLIRASLTLLESRLDARRFVRVHRSAIVPVDRVRELQRHVRGGHVVVLRDGTAIRMSRARRAHVRSVLGIHGNG